MEHFVRLTDKPGSQHLSSEFSSHSQLLASSEAFASPRREFRELTIYASREREMDSFGLR